MSQHGAAGPQRAACIASASFEAASERVPVDGGYDRLSERLDRVIDRNRELSQVPYLLRRRAIEEPDIGSGGKHFARSGDDHRSDRIVRPRPVEKRGHVPEHSPFIAFMASGPAEHDRGDSLSFAIERGFGSHRSIIENPRGRLKRRLVIASHERDE